MKLITPLAALALLGCGQALPDPDVRASVDCRVLPKLDVARAEFDAHAAWNRNDRQLLGVYSFTREVPGVDRTDLPIRIIEGTSDTDCEAENEIIRRYATAYNAAMVRLTTER